MKSTTHASLFSNMLCLERDQSKKQKSSLCMPTSDNCPNREEQKGWIYCMLTSGFISSFHGRRFQQKCVHSTEVASAAVDMILASRCNGFLDRGRATIQYPRVAYYQWYNGGLLRTQNKNILEFILLRSLSSDTAMRSRQFQGNPTQPIFNFEFISRLNPST